MTEQYFSDDSFEQELAVSVPLAATALRATSPRRRCSSRATSRATSRGVALPVDGGFLAEKSFVSGQGGSSFLSGNETRD